MMYQQDEVITTTPPPKALQFAETQAQACSKAILLGEHGVVYGSRALAVPLHCLTVKLRLKNFGPVASTRPAVSLRVGGKTLSEPFQNTVADAMSLLGLSEQCVDIEGTSKLLLGAGLGSSAAICVAVIRLLSKASGQHLTPDTVARLANQLESRFHGTPSGLDTAVVSWEKPIIFQRQQGATAFHASLCDGKPWRFALIDSGLRSPTVAMVKLAAPYFQGLAGEVRVRKMDQLVEECFRGLEAGSSATVAQAMHESCAMLQDAGVIPEPLQQLLQATRRSADVLAAKPTGAGGGGCVLSLLKPHADESAAEDLAAQLGHKPIYYFSLP